MADVADVTAAADTAYADTVATLALIAALVALVWQFVSVWLDRPRLTVTGRLAWGWNTSTIDGSRTRMSWELTTEVVNDGRAATGVMNVYWEFELVDGRLVRVTGTDPDDDSREIEVVGDLTILGGEVHPDLPLTLPRFGHATWVFHRDKAMSPMLDETTGGRPVVEYAARRRWFHKRRENGEHPSRRVEVGPWRPMTPPPLWDETPPNP